MRLAPFRNHGSLPAKNEPQTPPNRMAGGHVQPLHRVVIRRKEQQVQPNRHHGKKAVEPAQYLNVVKSPFLKVGMVRPPVYGCKT